MHDRKICYRDLKVSAWKSSMNSCVFTSVSTSIFSAPILMKSSKSSSISEDDSDLLLKNKSEKEKLSSLLRKQGNVLSLENFFRQLPFRQLMKWHETSFQAPDRKIKCLFTFHFINVISLVLFFFFFSCLVAIPFACLLVCVFVWSVVLQICLYSSNHR